MMKSRLNIINDSSEQLTNKNSLRLNIIDDSDEQSTNNKILKLNIIDDSDEPINQKILKLDVIDEPNKNFLKLKIVDEQSENKIYLPPKLNDNTYPSDHMCYVLKSLSSRRIYVGYTIDFNRRLRQHNGEIVGGAKKTEKARPWTPVCKIKGFYDKSSALRFEWRIQHSKKPRPNCISNISIILINLIKKGDGLLAWPDLNIEWI